MKADEYKEQVLRKIDLIVPELVKIADFIHENPELGYEEYESSKTLAQILKKHGFEVEMPFIGFETAFRATFQGKKSRPKVSLLAEYDALPEIGHACGHNLIGTACVGAAIGLTEAVKDLDGSVEVLGCPAEEVSGAKVDMVKEDVFEDVDFAMSVHPSDKTLLETHSLALDALEFVYRGKASHAAVAPEKGVNALNAVIALFNHVDALRQHVRSDVRIHGIITDGGVAPNVVPERAKARFYIRARDRSYLNEVVEKVMNCANAAAVATGAKLDVNNFENSFDNLISNETLKEIVKKYFEEFGEEIEEPPATSGSTDVGNVSHVVPTVNPTIKAVPKGVKPHTKEFTENTRLKLAHDALVKASKVLALSALEVLGDVELLDAMREDFNKALKT
jgi:amidohydrolase